MENKVYESNEFIERILSFDFQFYIRMKESFRRKVKSELRLRCKKLVESEDVYRFRLIKSIFDEIGQDVREDKMFQLGSVVHSFRSGNLLVLMKAN